jgi:1-acyl-sn-glycerol-3-phosphate acyltransferase
MPATDASPVALRSEKAMAFFNVAFGRTFAGSMRALRIPHWGLPDYAQGRPLVIYAPHPSWWDAILFMLLLRRYFINRPAFLPMDAEAIRKYPFMTKLGVFGVEQGSPRGAVRFLNTARQVLAAPHHMLWMNAPGRFVDVRERPVPITPGLVRLAEIAPDALIAPLAFEYAFWTEKQAEAFAAFGPAMEASTLLAMDRLTRTECLRDALTAVMDRLAQDVISRDPARFTAAIDGSKGMGGLYGAWQYLRAMIRGERYAAEHGPGQKAD